MSARKPGRDPIIEDLAARLNDPDSSASLETARALRGDGGRPPIVVSACLLGAPTRYDGGARRTAAVEQAVRERTVLPLCPELLGGLGCPRAPIHFAQGDGRGLSGAPGAPPARAVDDAGIDRGPALLQGARRALALARAAGAREAILKERSPSCGCRQIHAAGGVVSGRGVFAVLASEAGIACRSDEELPPAPAGVRR